VSVPYSPAFTQKQGGAFLEALILYGLAAYVVIKSYSYLGSPVGLGGLFLVLMFAVIPVSGILAALLLSDGKDPNNPNNKGGFEAAMGVGLVSFLRNMVLLLAAALHLL